MDFQSPMRVFKGPTGNPSRIHRGAQRTHEEAKIALRELKMTDEQPR